MTDSVDLGSGLDTEILVLFDSLTSKFDLAFYQILSLVVEKTASKVECSESLVGCLSRFV